VNACNCKAVYRAQSVTVCHYCEIESLEWVCCVCGGGGDLTSWYVYGFKPRRGSEHKIICTSRHSAIHRWDWWKWGKSPFKIVLQIRLSRVWFSFKTFRQLQLRLNGWWWENGVMKKVGGNERIQRKLTHTVFVHQKAYVA